MTQSAQPPRSNFQTLTLLAGFAALAATLPLLSFSLYAFLAVAAVVLAVVNVAFLREFDIWTFRAAATLAAFNLLVVDVIAIIMLAFLWPQNSAADYLLSALPVLAIAYPVMQAFFIREHWWRET
jgi:hypothetical protein